MSGLRIFLLIIMTAVMLVMTVIVQAGQIECDVLQYKLGRLYFPHGQEEMVFEHSPFTIYKGDDSICSGMIGFSGDGVSYSEPLGYELDNDKIESLHAEIATAEIDSTSTIRIGFELPGGENCGPVGSEKTFDELNPPLRAITKNGNPLELHFYNSFLEMTFGLEAHKIDGFISFNEYKPSDEDIITVAYPAEFFAVLFPIVSHPVNDRGVLSTSMYYRFNPLQSSSFFSGDGVRPFNSLYLKDAPTGRFYDYDPEKGRDLLKALKKKPKEISIAVSEPTLIKTANYFVDILNRDRIKCRFEKDRDNYHDIYLDLVPLSEDDPAGSLRYIVRVLSADTLSGEPVNTVIRIIDNYIKQGDKISDVAKAAYYYDRAERSLIDDLGVFPLFRPIVYMTSYRYLSNFNYDMYISDRLDEVTRIVMPGGGTK